MINAGTRLGVYEIVCALGAGGMGEVYRARDTRLGRDVALKLLPQAFSDDPARLERFAREARAVAALNHPHIVTIYSTEEAGDVRFLTMELVDGATLETLIPPGGLSAARFLEIALPLADALAAAHQKQITHRDLKPANVMISTDGRLKVLDFGLARVDAIGAPQETVTRAPLTGEGTIVGTVPYMSPEQLAGRAIDHRSDLFSLGTILYEMATGARPFDGDSSPLLISSILRDTPASVSQTRRDLPEPLARLIERCLEKRPDDRVQTARDVHNELRHIQKLLDTSAGKPVQSGAVKAGDASLSIAVLPFTDLSAARDQDWFCDGMAEEILNALAQLPGLRVAARASTFSLRGKGDDLRAIGQKLNVTSVLEGSVRRSGDRLRITARLSDVAQNIQLWSEQYDREMRDVFDVQDDIARSIAGRLKVSLAGGSDVQLVARPTDSLEAYELLLKGRQLLNRRGRAIIDALAFFERALTLDPALAEAHALAGDAYRLHGLYGIKPAKEMMARARAAAERALALDPSQPEALATLANIALVHDRDVMSGIALSDRALARDPDHVRALAERALCIVLLDPIPPDIERRSMHDVRRAREIDPLNAWVVAIQSLCLGLTGQLDEALVTSRQAVALDAENFTARWMLVWTLAATGRHQDALAAAQPALTMSGRHPWILTLVAGAHAALGDRAAVAAVYEELTDRARTTHVGCAEQAAVAASAGHLAESRALLSRAVAERDPYLVFWKLTGWEAVNADPEARRLLRSTGVMGFAPQHDA